MAKLPVDINADKDDPENKVQDFVKRDDPSRKESECVRQDMQILIKRACFVATARKQPKAKNRREIASSSL